VKWFRNKTGPWANSQIAMEGPRTYKPTLARTDGALGGEVVEALFQLNMRDGMHDERLGADGPNGVAVNHATVQAVACEFVWLVASSKRSLGWC